MNILINKNFVKLKQLLKGNNFFYTNYLLLFNLIERVKNSYTLNKFIKNIQNIKKNKYSENKKKILFLISNIDTGGAEKQMIKLLSLAKNKKLDCKLLTFNFEFNKDKINNTHFFLNNYVKKNIKIIKIRDINKELNTICGNKNIKKLLIRHNLNFFDNFEKLIFLHTFKEVMDYKPSIIHSYLDTQNIFAGLMALFTNVKKIILNIRSISPNNHTWCRYYYYEFYKLFLNYKNIVFIANSKNGALSYAKWLNCNPKKFKIINNIYNFKKKLNKINSKKQTVIFGSIGRLDKNKNVIYAIKLIEHLIKEYKLDLKFLIAGDGVLKNYLYNYILKNDLVRHIKLLGEVKDINNFFNTINIFLFTTKVEGTPNVLLEAQNYQLPIFSTRVGGIPDCVIKNYTTYFLNGNNLEEDAKIALNKLKDKKFLKKRNFFKIKSKLIKFSEDEVYKNLRKLYNV
jgi:glycosyltransferase involved in cell wall biosynthesis